jgi:hypothetical protein
MIACALGSTSAQAQQEPSGCEALEGTPPGLYATTDEGRTFLIKDGKQVELAPGEAAFANEGSLTCIQSVPDFLNWPCSTQAAQSRKFATYRLDELASANRAQEIVRRYFDIHEVIEPIPDWLEGESHGDFAHQEIIQFASPEFWYKPDPAVPITHEKRPKTLLISLYVGINQVVVDNYTIDALRRHNGGDRLPVVFVFNDSNVVPISYFGDNVSLEEVYEAFHERAIKVADVPQWPLGDYHLAPTIEEFEKYFDIPALEDIAPERLQALQQSLQATGYGKKPVFVTLMAGNSLMVIDDPDRVRAAESLGMMRVPTVIVFYEEDQHLARCGPGTPAGSAGVGDATTPIESPAPPPPERPASDS